MKNKLVTKVACKHYGVWLTLGILALGSDLSPGQTIPSLGAAETFAVLAYSTITNTGEPSTIVGDVGLSPGVSITGIAPGDVTGGSIYINSFAGQARLDAETAFAGFAALDVSQDLSSTDLATTLTPGVYSFSSSSQLTGTLTLNGNGPFIFLIGSTLITATDSSINLIGGATASNVYFLVGSSATLGVGTDFQGTIIANADITAATDTSLLGRLIALNGAVTLSSSSITVVPESGTAALLVSSMAFFLTRSRRRI